jgi:cystathionine beta-lyase
MHLNFNRLIDRKKTESEKWLAYDEDVLPLWVADMDFAAPQAVIDALQERVEHGIFGYPREMPQLRQVIADWCLEQYGWEISTEAVLLIPGVVTGFNLAAQAVAEQGDGILFHTPAYPPFLSVAQNGGFVQQAIELVQSEDGAYRPDNDSFRSLINSRSKIFLLCNPQNPTGRVFSQQELGEMAESCLRHQMTIISDEIHCDLVFKGKKHIPIASLDADIANSTITLIAPSKTFNIAGLEASAAIITNPEIRKKVQLAGRGVIGWVNLLGQTAALAAYQKGLPWLKAVLEYLEANRDFMDDFTRAELPGIKMNKPEATYLGWMDCRQAGISGNPYEFFLKHARVALNDGARFGKGGEGFVRLNFGCPRVTLEEALNRMKEALRKI